MAGDVSSENTGPVLLAMLNVWASISVCILSFLSQ